MTFVGMSCWPSTWMFSLSIDTRHEGDAALGGASRYADQSSISRRRRSNKSDRAGGQDPQPAQRGAARPTSVSHARML